MREPKPMAPRELSGADELNVAKWFVTDPLALEIGCDWCDDDIATVLWQPDPTHYNLLCSGCAAKAREQN